MIRASRDHEDNLSPEVKAATEEKIYQNRLKKAFGYDDMAQPIDDKFFE
jgi:hypothetical protein